MRSLGSCAAAACLGSRQLRSRSFLGSSSAASGGLVCGRRCRLTAAARQPYDAGMHHSSARPSAAHSKHHVGAIANQTCRLWRAVVWSTGCPDMPSVECQIVEHQLLRHVQQRKPAH
eukprot:354551-Chlamydomonas_euryale.AAC.7